MRFDEEAPRPRPESVVPMINVVFLLLIFFMISAELAPPDPLDVEPPASAGAEPGSAKAILQVSAGGETAYGPARGEAALGLAVAEAGSGPLALRADARLPAEDLARLVAALASQGVEAVEIVTEAE
jgi:biopolymer transport protein ExbD